jgi:hypothetical protein
MHVRWHGPHGTELMAMCPRHAAALRVLTIGRARTHELVSPDCTHPASRWDHLRCTLGVTELDAEIETASAVAMPAVVSASTSA